MKTITLKNFKVLATSFSILLIAISISFSACKKSNNVVVASGLNVINAASTSVPQDFYLDNVKVNTTPLAYTQSTGYVTVSGTHVAQFRTSATSSVNTTFSASFSPGQFYTLFYTDDQSFAGNINDNTPTLPGEARVRFVNLSSALSSSVDFDLAGGSPVASGLSYKQFSDYYDVSVTSTFTLNASGSNSALLSIPANLQAGKIYTIYVSGSTTATLTYGVLTEIN